MNIDLIYFYWTIGILLGFQLILLALLCIRKWQRNRENDRQKQVYEDNLELFVDYLMTDNWMIPKALVLRKNFEVAERIFSETINDVKDTYMLEKLEQAAESIFSETYLSQLRRGSWSTRVNTLYFIEDFKLTSLKSFLQQHLKKLKVWDEEKNQTVRALAALNDLSIIDYLNKDRSATLQHYLDVFSRFDDDTFGNAIKLSKENYNPMCRVAILSFIGLTKNVRYQPILEVELQNENLEMRIQALKGLYRLSYISNIELLIPFFDSSSWQERMFSCRISGVLMLEVYEPFLEKLLGDKEWWVRNAAAESLLQIFGEEKLLFLSKNHLDLYARDMAVQWISSKKGGSKK
ncbi:HEAT repeat domain-containing protein [Psychrobacillus sp. FJAT-51614]|uniref:HEAT repeat domain-containing protein n=1 Tax=Psychrobacillus mangrovi TaxID=3117745 RepID=A0ABU8F5D8_9BACI